MERLEEERLAIAELHHRAEVEDGESVAEVLGDREVVDDEEVGEPEPFLQAAQEVQHLCLDRDVERGDGLVQEDQLGAENERAGDGDPLTLTA